MTCRRALVALVLGALTLPALAVAATPAGALEPHPRPAPSAEPWPADPALTRARRALDGVGAPAGHRPEATLALRDLFLARPTLDDDARRTAGRLLARPTDRAADPLGDGYSVKARRTCGPRVCVHWVPTTDDAPAKPRWVKTTLKVMENVWRFEVGSLGYRAPASDRGRGGDDRFDVYLKDLGKVGLYGYCAPEGKVPGRKRQAFGYCVLDNDFATSQYHRKPGHALRVTAAHEFFHAIQFAYDYREDPWLLESTATWMEDQFADDVDDNLAYLPYGQLAHPARPLDTYAVSGYTHYGNWLWWEFLSQRFGPAVVKRVLARAATGFGNPNDYSVQALKNVLDRRGGFERILADYAVANTRAAKVYPQGADYPTAKPRLQARVGKGITRFTTRLDHLASASVRLRPAPRFATNRWRIRVDVDGPNAKTSPVVMAVVTGAKGKVARKRVRLDDRGRGSITLPFNTRQIQDLTLVFVNASTRYRCGESTTFACRGVARDDRRPFTFRARVSRS